MGAHRLQQFRYSLEQQVAEFWGVINIGASGAVSSFSGANILNVVKESTAGQYSITLGDKYFKFLEFSAKIVDDAISQVTSIQVLEDPAALQADFKADSTFKIQLLAPTDASTTTLIAANATSGAQVMFRVTVRNTSVGVGSGT